MGIKHSRPVPPFMRYCSAIIPTMFDDSLSYYEALCALNRFIQKNLVEVINNNATVTQEYIELTNQLKEYVENYFDNLDVQQEINNKLDEMAESGYFDILIDEYVKPKIDDLTEYVNNSVSNLQTQISAAISNPPIPVASVDDMTDTTKIYVNTTDGNWYYYNNGWISGGTYQSATYNEDIQFLKSNLYYQSNLTPYLTDLDYWRRGSINSTTGLSTTNIARIRTLYAFKVQKGTRISVTSGYVFNVFAYDTYIGPASGDFSGFRPLKEAVDGDPVVVSADCYIKIVVGDPEDHDLETDGELNAYAADCLENLFVTAYSIDNLKLKEQLKDYGTTVKQIFAKGNLNSTTGFVTRTNNTRLTSLAHIRVNGGLCIFMNDPKWCLNIGKYDENLNFIGYVSMANSQEPVVIRPIDAKYIMISIRRSINQSEEITPEELYDINTKSFIFTKFDETFSQESPVSGESLTHLVQKDQAGFNYPSINFPVDFTFNKILRYSDYNLSNTNTTNTQSVCTVNENLVVACTHTDDTNVTLIKYNPETGSVLQQVNDHSYGHANGMAYIKPLNKIFIAGFHYNVPDEEADWGRIYVANADTLEYDSDFNLDSVLSPIFPNYKGVGAVGYCEKRGLIAYLLRNMGNSLRAIAFFDTAGNYVSHFTFTQSFTGGICCLDDYIIVCANERFYIYDYEGTPMGVTSNYITSTDLISEGESLAILNGKIYMNANNTTNEYNDYRYANVIEMHPTGYKHIDLKTYLGL